MIPIPNSCFTTLFVPVFDYLAKNTSSIDINLAQMTDKEIVNGEWIPIEYRVVTQQQQTVVVKVITFVTNHFPLY